MFKVKNLISHHNYVVFLLKRLQIQMGVYLGFGTDLEFCFDLQCLKIQVHFNIPVKTRLPPEMSPDDLTGSHLLRIRLPLSASAQTSSSLRVRWRGVKWVWPDLTPAVSSTAPQHFPHVSRPRAESPVGWGNGLSATCHEKETSLPHQFFYGSVFRLSDSLMRYWER